MRPFRSLLDGMRRETSQQTKSRVADAVEPIFQIIDPASVGAATGGASSNGKGRNGATFVTDGSTIGMTPPLASTPTIVTLPVQVTAKTRAIRARLMSGLLAAKQDLDKKRTELRGKLAAAAAILLTRRANTAAAQGRLEEARAARDTFRESFPSGQARTLDQRPSLVFRLVPWALWLADTWIIARAWGLYGPAPVPFLHASVGLTEFTSLARAGLVSYGLIFGVRLAAGRLAGLAGRFRHRAPLPAGLVDAAVIVTVLATAVRLALSTAVLQSVLMQIAGGGSDTTVPRSVLFSIVSFLIAVSAASGYFGHDPEQDQAQANEKKVRKSETKLLSAIGKENKQKGRVRVIREQLRGLDRAERLLTDEQEQHIEQAVMEHKSSNLYVYGLDQDDSANATSGASRPRPRRGRP